MNRRTFITSVAAIAGSLCGSGVLLAQISTRPIRVLVPLAPGGAVDPYARLVADQMAKNLGRVIIVEHKPERMAMSDTNSPRANRRMAALSWSRPRR